MVGMSNNYNGNNTKKKRGGWDQGGISGAIRAAHRGGGNNGDNGNNEEDIPEQYKGIDPKLIESIENDIIGANINVKWEDIAGLEFAKRTCQEIVVLPIISPHLFSGLRRLPKGLLLFGPPGTGKTLIGKAIASQTGATFFSISASSLTSKWIGQGEKLVRALFAVASYRQPSVIFIDEIDSLLSQRSSDENEASRRIKTEFLVQLDGAGSGADDKILVLGATNRPQELDEAARRRFMKRLYIPLPNDIARESLLRHLLKQNVHILTDDDIEDIVKKTDGYSGSDLDGLCREAAMAPLREKTSEFMKTAGGSMIGLKSLRAEDLRPIRPNDLRSAMRQVRASVSQQDLAGYVEWDKTFGSFSHSDELSP
jgi:SpoVK/Ycf46/Vps4 family AAA+-type ATPase